MLSTPLTLGLNLSDTTTVDTVWDIITNTEAVAIDQAWAGAPGGLLTEANETVFFPICDWHPRNCTLPVSQHWWKQLPNCTAAVMATEVQFAMFPVAALPCAAAAGGCGVRNVWRHADAGGPVCRIIPRHPRIAWLGTAHSQLDL